MSKQIVKHVKLKTPYEVKARAKDKWDIYETFTFTKDGERSFDFNMQDYDGLNLEKDAGSYNETLLYSTNTVLPWKYDYSSKLEVNDYCLQPYGLNYSNIKRMVNVLNCWNVGSVSIDDDFIATDFSTSKFLVSNTNFNFGTSTWKIETKVKTGEINSNQKYIFGQPYVNQTTPQLALEGNVLKVWLSSTGSSWDIASGSASTNTLEANTVYTISLQFTGSTYEVYVNDELYIQVTSSTALYSANEPLCIGYDNGNSAWNGSIYLKDFKFYVDNTETWSAMVKQYKYATASRVTKVGSPTIDDTTCIAKSFSTANYLTTSKSISFSSDTIFMTKIMIGLDSKTEYIYQSSPNRYAGLLLYKSSSAPFTFSLTLRTSNKSSSVGTITTPAIFYPYQTVWLAIIWDYARFDSASGTGYKLLYRFKESDAWTVTNGTHIGASTVSWDYSSSYVPRLGFYSYNTGYYFSGQMDLKSTGFSSSYSSAYNISYPCASITYESLPGCTYDYFDDGSSKEVNAFVIDKSKEIVLSTQDSIENGYKLDTYTIPEHNLVTYERTLTNSGWVDETSKGFLKKDTSYEIIVQGGGGGGSAYTGGAGAYWRGIVTPSEDSTFGLMFGQGGKGCASTSNAEAGHTSKLLGSNISIECPGGQGSYSTEEDPDGSLSGFSYPPVTSFSNMNVIELDKSSNIQRQAAWSDGSIITSESGKGGDIESNGDFGRIGVNRNVYNLTLNTIPEDTSCTITLSDSYNLNHVVTGKTAKCPSEVTIHVDATAEGFLPYSSYVYLYGDATRIIYMLKGTWYDSGYYINNLFSMYYYYESSNNNSFMFYVNTNKAAQIEDLTEILIFTDTDGKTFKIKRDDSNENNMYVQILVNDEIIGYFSVPWSTIFASAEETSTKMFLMTTYEDYYSEMYTTPLFVIYDYNTGSSYTGTANVSTIPTFSGELDVNDDLYLDTSLFSVSSLGFTSGSFNYYSSFYPTSNFIPDICHYKDLNKYTFTINCLTEGATVQIKVGSGEYTETTSVEATEQSVIYYTVTKDGYLSVSGTQTLTGNITKDITLYQGSISGILTNIIDGTNFEKVDDYIQSGSASYNVNNGKSFSYVTYTPTEDMDFVISAKASSESGFDIFGCYVGTALYDTVTNSSIRSKTTDGNGSWLFTLSGAGSQNTYYTRLTGGTTYYIHFYYLKDSSVNNNDDRGYIYGCNI